MPNILIVSDDCRIPTGVGGQSAEIIKGLTKKGNKLFQVSPHFQDRPATTFVHKFDTGEEVVIYSSKKYDDADLILKIVRKQKIDAVILFTDPHRFINIFLNYRAISNVCPIIYYTIWDSWLNADKDGKPHYNSFIYQSCNHLACISRQTQSFVDTIVNRLPESERPKVSYLPHGVDPAIYRPLPPEQVAGFRKQFFNGNEFDFVVLFNSRNQGRKKCPDLIYSYAQFAKTLPAEQQKKMALVLHTDPIADTGTNLMEVIQALAPHLNVYIDGSKGTNEQINMLYNICDLLVLPSNAEGFGLTPLEFVMSGGVTAVSVVGGLQDQCNLLDAEGQPVLYSDRFTGKTSQNIVSHGSWVYPIVPQAYEIIGNPATPYLENGIVSHEGIQNALSYWYNIPKEERKKRGLEGRNWFIENGFTAQSMVEGFDKVIKDTIANAKKTKLFEVYISQ